MVGWPWPRAVALYDMNAYFASVEQKDDTRLRGRPVAVTNGMYGRTVIACSYEAKREGVATGMPWYEAIRCCPDLVRRPSRSERYQELSRRILSELRREVTPDIEVFSIDEAFLDMTGVSHRYCDELACIRHIQAVIEKSSGLAASVGLSVNKTMSKYAAKKMRPRGLTVIAPDQVTQALHALPVGELCGIGPGIQKFFARFGVRTCDQIEQMPVGILRQRFGYLGQRLWWMCHGVDPDPVKSHQKPDKTMGHSKVIAAHMQHPEGLRAVSLHLVQRLCHRLRVAGRLACRIHMGMRTCFGPLREDHVLSPATNDPEVMYRLFCQFVMRGRGVSYIAITAVELSTVTQQSLQLLSSTQERLKLIDRIQHRFGRSALQSARLLSLSLGSVIAPTWREDSGEPPSGS